MTSPGGEVPHGGRGPEQVHELATIQQPLLANPDTYDLAEAARQVFANGILSGFASIGEGIGQVLEDLADALFGGIVAEDHPALQRIRDGQLDLVRDIGRMADISGYACAFMGANRFKDRAKWVLMEFDEELGEPKNAVVENNGITLAEGTWVIDAHCTHDHHVDRLTSRIRIEVLRPDGTVYSIKEQYGEVFPNKWTTRQVRHTVVTPGPGYHVRVLTYYNVGTFVGVYNRLLWRGGTHLSHLTAHRLNASTENAKVREDVPTIGASQGDDG